MANYLDSYDAPKSLGKDGRPPATRMQDAGATRERVTRLLQADSGARSRQRALVKGLVDGNPPYKAKALRDAGRADACNVNWRTAESYLNSAIGAFYDLFSESATYAHVELDIEENQKQVDASRIASEEFQRLQKEDRSWDHTMQNSQFEMVLYGVGPLAFQDSYDWRCHSVSCRDLLVPDRSKSDITSWEEAAILCSYSASQLYTYIKDSDTASNIGWNTGAVREAIMSAHPKTHEGGMYRNWEWHQEQLKTKSLSYSAECSVINVAHYYLREFPDKENPEGAITCVMVSSPEAPSETANKYLYKKERIYDSWEQFLHPMYYDNLGGGLHHSVTGMGVKMYAAMEFQNRLLCNLADKTFAPVVLFKPTTSSSDQAFNIVRFADYGKLPPGFDMVQTPISPMIEEGLAFNREIGQQIAANLSAYRQNLQKIEGNPLTATEVQQRASEQARLGKTQLNRYYNQLDWLYTEKYRRAVNARNEYFPGGKAAREFQKRCKERGVTLEQLKKIRSVSAARVVGEGSQFMRQQSLEFLLGIAGTLPQSGRDNLVRDVIASRAGQHSVNRYFPIKIDDSKQQDQAAFAMVQVGAMKDGVPAIVTETQDHMLFIQIFLNAATEAVQSVSQGANPMEVIRFVELAGHAIAEHMRALSSDKSRSQEVKAIEQQLRKLGAAVDTIKKQMRNGANGQAQQGQRQAQVMNDEQLKNFEASQEQRRRETGFQLDQKRKDAKLSNQLAQSNAKAAASAREKAASNGGE